MKAELIPTTLYGDGRPRDVGTDRALANNLNRIIDYTTAHQAPFLTSQQSLGSFTDWVLLYFGPMFVGMNNHTAARALLRPASEHLV